MAKKKVEVEEIQEEQLDEPVTEPAPLTATEITERDEEMAAQETESVSPVPDEVIEQLPEFEPPTPEAAGIQSDSELNPQQTVTPGCVSRGVD